MGSQGMAGHAVRVLPALVGIRYMLVQIMRIAANIR